MTVNHWLEQLRPTWLERVSTSLSTIKSVQEGFVEPAGKFYDVLLNAVTHEDPGCVEPVLVNWIEALTLTEGDIQNIEVIQILNTFLENHMDVAQEYLESGNAAYLTQKLLPIYTYAIEFVHRYEIKHKIEHVLVELEQVNDLVKRVEQSKADFISVAAHELKTPLTLIEGYSSMLKEHINLHMPDTLAEQYLSGIEIGYSRLREIVEDMIAVSLIDNNILSIQYQPVWIIHLIEILAYEFKAKLTERNISLSLSRFPGAEEMTYGDGEKLLQAFRKLVSNAIKYTPDGGAIFISGQLLPGYLEITIKDTGIGIDPNDQLRIFDKFGRLGNPSLHSSSKTEFKGGGPGLGLSITKGIIEAHGGAIWVESEGYDETRYNGSTFHVLLPLRSGPPDDKASQIVKHLVD
jgi:signal transduction histidine kinase